MAIELCGLQIRHLMSRASRIAIGKIEIIVGVNKF